MSNTSPLLNLAIIGELELAKTELGSVTIPPAVRDEFRLKESRPGARALYQAIEEEGWLRVEEPSQRALRHALRRRLHRGEADAITLALDLDADVLLLDEREARREAERLNLEMTGLLGLLLRADRSGLIDSLSDFLDRLENEAGFWIAPGLREKILQE